MTSTMTMPQDAAQQNDWVWPETTLTGVTFVCSRRVDSMAKAPSRRVLFRHTRLKVFQKNGVTCCGLVAGSEIANGWRNTLRYPIAASRILSALVSDSRLTDASTGREGTRRLRRDLIVSTPQFAATLVVGSQTLTTGWELANGKQLLSEMDLTFRERFNFVQFTLDDGHCVIDAQGYTRP